MRRWIATFRWWLAGKPCVVVRGDGRLTFHGVHMYVSDPAAHQVAISLEARKSYIHVCTNLPPEIQKVVDADDRAAVRELSIEQFKRYVAGRLRAAFRFEPPYQENPK